MKYTDPGSKGNICIMLLGDFFSETDSIFQFDIAVFPALKQQYFLA